MKKFLSILCLAVLSVFTFSSCKDDEGNEGSGNSVDVNEIIDGNVERPDVEPVDLEAEISNVNEIQFTIDSTLDYNYASMGFIVFADNYDNLGVYSLLVDDNIVGARFPRKLTSYNITSTEHLGGIIEIRYQGETLAFDLYGNLLVQDDLKEKYFSYKTHLINDVVYLEVTKQSSELLDDVVKYYKYAEDGTISIVSNLPQERPEYEEPEIDPDLDEPNLDAGTQYVDLAKLDLDLYGLDGHYFSHTNNLWTLFDSSNQPVTTFTLPANTNSYVIGNKLLYQTKYQLPDTAFRYDYFDGEHKYNLSTTQIDLATGNVSNITLNYYIKEFSPFKDKEGFYKYAIVDVDKFESGMLEAGHSYLIDGSGTILSETTGLHLESLVQIGNNIFNKVTKVLYNSEFKEIAYLGSINPVLDFKNKLIIGTYNGKKGALNSDGKIVIPFEYTSLNLDYIKEGKLLGFIYDKAYQIDLNTYQNRLICENCSKLNNGLYQGTSDGYVVYFDNTGNEYTSHSITYSELINQNSIINNKMVRFVIARSNYSSNNIRAYAFTEGEFNLVENEYQEDLDKKILLGESKKSPVTFVLGENKVFTTDNTANSNYYLFKPIKSGYYTFGTTNKSFNLSKLELRELEDDTPNSDYVYTNVSVDKYNETKNNVITYFYTVSLEEGKDYIFTIKSNNYNSSNEVLDNNFFKVDLSEETGMNPKYPLSGIEINEEFTLKAQKDEYGDYRSLYFTVTATETERFTLNGLEKYTVKYCLFDNYISDNSLNSVNTSSQDNEKFVYLDIYQKYIFKVSIIEEDIIVTVECQKGLEGHTRYNPLDLNLNELSYIQFILNNYTYSSANFTYTTKKEDLYYVYLYNYDTYDYKIIVTIDGEETRLSSNNSISLDANQLLNIRIERKNGDKINEPLGAAIFSTDDIEDTFDFDDNKISFGDKKQITLAPNESKLFSIDKYTSDKNRIYLSNTSYQAIDVYRCDSIGHVILSRFDGTSGFSLNSNDSYLVVVTNTSTETYNGYLNYKLYTELNDIYDSYIYLYDFNTFNLKYTNDTDTVKYIKIKATDTKQYYYTDLSIKEDTGLYLKLEDFAYSWEYIFKLNSKEVLELQIYINNVNYDSKQLSVVEVKAEELKTKESITLEITNKFSPLYIDLPKIEEASTEGATEENSEVFEKVTTVDLTFTITNTENVVIYLVTNSGKLEKLSDISEKLTVDLTKYKGLVVYNNLTYSDYETKDLLTITKSVTVIE